MRSDYAAAYPDLYRRHWWWRVREEILLGTIRRLLAGRVNRPRILDVGCGAGLFFDALEPLGEVYGIESDASSVERSGRWRDRIAVGVLDDDHPPAQPFDLVLLLDALEHVPDPVRVLANIRTVLAPEGRLVLTVPAFSWLWTTHDELNLHHRRYSMSTISRALDAADMTPKESRFLFQSLIVPKLLVKARESLFRSAPAVPHVPGELANTLLTSWYRAENRALRSLPFGGSILVVAAARATAAPSGR